MKINKLTVIILALLLLTGCRANTPPQDSSPPSSATNPETTNTPSPPAGYRFTIVTTTIEMGAPATPAIQTLGEPLHYFEAPSCAFEGIDKIYYYSGFELYTYPFDDDDYILSVILTDDSVSTEKQIYIGMTLDDIIAAYGDEYAQNAGQYTYTLNNTTLSFLIENGTIASIAFRAA
jgi:hypothetical protein